VHVRTRVNLPWICPAFTRLFPSSSTSFSLLPGCKKCLPHPTRAATMLFSTRFLFPDSSLSQSSLRSPHFLLPVPYLSEIPLGELMFPKLNGSPRTLFPIIDFVGIPPSDDCANFFSLHSLFHWYFAYRSSPTLDREIVPLKIITSVLYLYLTPSFTTPQGLVLPLFV